MKNLKLKNLYGILLFLYVILQRATSLTEISYKLSACIFACEGYNLSKKPSNLACLISQADTLAPVPICIQTMLLLIET